jgi:DNA polymerase III alpha subunit
MFVELHASSAFSFLEAASLPETLVERAAALGYSALALVDRDGVYGAPRFHKAATAAGLKAIIGCGSRSPSRLKPDLHSDSPEQLTARRPQPGPKPGPGVCPFLSKAPRH